jgi:DNA-binding transcriptional MerR regulator
MSAAAMDGSEDKVVRTTFVRLPAEIRKQSQTRYTMAQLEELTGLSPRTIRFYIQEGLVGPASGRGPSATYGRDQLLRLMRITELKTEHPALEQIRERLSALSTADLEAHYAVRGGPEEERWRRVRIHPNLELHVREVDGPGLRFERALDEIVQHARIVLERFEDER